MPAPPPAGLSDGLEAIHTSWMPGAAVPVTVMSNVWRAASPALPLAAVDASASSTV